MAEKEEAEAVELRESSSEERVSQAKEAEDSPDALQSRLERIQSTYQAISPSSTRPQLAHLASQLSRFSSHRTTTTTPTTNNLQKLDTLQEEGIEYGHPALDPANEQFDLYRWLRFIFREMMREGVQQRHAGFSFSNLNVSGTGSALQLQQTVASLLMAPLRPRETLGFGSTPEKKILRNFDGIVNPGEMLIVLGRPGSGCSTFLKTVCARLKGLDVHPDSVINYDGIAQEQMKKQFTGDLAYSQEVDVHFPHLTVGETLEFAAAARTGSNRVFNSRDRQEYSKYIAQVIMTVLGLSHTYNTKVGNDFVRGVSGGERKRVSIAETALAGAEIAAWDNSTRGLDAATALEFVQALRLASDIGNKVNAVAIYQASQAIYDVFDKAIVLYEGREIYFGPCAQAERFFHDQGWLNPPRQTTGDFLTSVTNPQERKPREGFEHKVPRTPDEFESYWKASPEYRALQKEIQLHDQQQPLGDQAALSQFQASKAEAQADHVRRGSPYLISIPMQVRLCTKRAYQRLWNDKASTLTVVIGQIVMALIIGSIFFGTPQASAGFYSKGSVLFFAVLLNALLSISEINSLYDQRAIVEKQRGFAFYHPWCEAFAGILSDIPVKFLISTCFNIILYFLAGLRTEPSQFFLYFMIVFISTLCMSTIFRTLAAATKTVAGAMALAGVMVLALVIYTGFVIKLNAMHPWFKWLNYLNPIRYAFECLVSNEFHGRQFICSQFVPAYPQLTGDSFICATVGAVAGQRTVSGDRFIDISYGYSYSHFWRNFGIIIAFWIFFLFTYLLATELNSESSSSAEFLVFRRGHVPSYLQNLDQKQANEEPTEKPEAAVGSGPDTQQANALPPTRDIFTWKDVSYTVPVKGGERQLLNSVSGWVKPGTLTALMGVSGAGKTTLLDVLAHRVSMGVVTGDMLVNGKALDQSFQRKTGYVQQQDLHLETTTVREALRFSAALRQPKSVSKKEKNDFVEEVIQMLGMGDFSEAIVGVPGEGLNVEQRKLLTIGVELAAKPDLLVFLDEPTSGLDSQSAWSICAFLRKLADSGQAILCTIHQPSAVLFQEFDRLLFLAKGGKTVYFGDIGPQSRTMLDYFEQNGARHCDDKENPAEYMLEIIGAGASGKAAQDWPTVWKQSEEAQNVQTELGRIHEETRSRPAASEDTTNRGQYAMPFTSQLSEVILRVFQQYWRTPAYIWGKIMLATASGLFIGFSFWMPNGDQAGLQNTLFAVFMVTTIFSTLVQQIMPRFVLQRSLFEVRERPSKTYSWAAFMVSNLLVEIPYQVLLGILVWACFYYPVFGASQPSETQGILLLFCVQFFILASSFAHLCIAALPDAETAGNIATLLFSMMITFNGVLQSPTALPGFWIFMYRVSPLTYIIGGMTGAGLHGRQVQCSNAELSVFDPPSGQTCEQYLSAYLSAAPGSLYNPSATSGCQYCQLNNGDEFLAGSNIYYSQRWRNFGIGWAYIAFNIFAATLLYFAFRVQHWSPSTVVRGLQDAGAYVGRMFRRRSGKIPEGKAQTENVKAF